MTTPADPTTRYRPPHDPAAGTPRGWLDRLVPALRWLRTYSRADARADITSGITTAIMLIPQGIAYAMIAGLPAEVGLYASTVPLVFYAMFGTSRQLAVGPVAIVSLLTVATLTPVVTSMGYAVGGPEYVGMAATLMMLVGLISLGMGALRLGFLTNFLSHPVILGFTFAAALIIGLGEVKNLLGLQISTGREFGEMILGTAEHLGQTNWIAAAIGVPAAILMFALKAKWPRVPSQLVVVVAATVVVWAAGLSLPGQGDQAVRVVGDVPSGLPGFAVPPLDAGWITALLPGAFLIAALGYVESISVARAFAAKRRYDVDANQEFVGLGMANLGGAFFGAFPVTGGFSRTAFNGSARTPLAAVITAATIAVTLLLFTPAFAFMPKPVLAAAIVAAVLPLINLRDARHIFRVKRSDGVLLLITFVATLTLGIEWGIATGIGSSLAMFLYRSSQPHAATLGRLPGSPDVFRNTARFPEAETVPGIPILRIDATLYFGNVTFMKDRVRRLCTDAGSEPVRALILDASGINDIDSSAAAALLELGRELSERRIGVYLAAAKGPVREVLARALHDAGPAADSIRQTKTISEALAAATSEDAPAYSSPS